MKSLKTIQILGFFASLTGLGATILSQYVNDKKMEEEIDRRIDEKLNTFYDEKENEDEES